MNVRHTQPWRSWLLLIVALWTCLAPTAQALAREEPADLRKYLYAQANPVMGFDPSGNMSLVEVANTAFTIGTLASKLIVAYNIGHLLGSAVRFTYDEEYQIEDLLDESLKTGGDILLGWGVGKLGSYVYGRLIGPLARKLTPLIWERARGLGRAAEAYITNQYSVFKNTKSLAQMGGKGEFVPDAITNSVLREIKNVGRLAWDNQLKAFAEFAKQTGRKYVIHVRPGTKVSDELIAKANGVFGPNSRGKLWDIISDIPEDMKVIAR